MRTTTGVAPIEEGGIAMVPQDSGMVAVRNILTRLCKRSGLSPDRLRSTEIDVLPLLDLLAVRQYARRAGIDREEAVLPLVRDLALRLEPTHRLVVDAELSLGLLRENPPAGVDPARLYAQDLGERREYLAERWARLHEALGAQPVSGALTVRSLRGAPERRAFTELAAQLTTASVFDGAHVVDFGNTSEHAAAEPVPVDDRGVVTVIGDAVVDHMYVVDGIPGSGATARGSYREHPGGKGLTRAVAAARLGLRARLISAVGDDDAGDHILDYLRSERVDTELVKVVPYAPTPVTAVIVARTGAAATIGCKDERIRLSAQELRSEAIRAAIAASDAVLLTFEQPTGVIEQIMGQLRALPRRPLVVLHPAPRLDRPQYLYQHLGAVDYLVGGDSDLRALAMAGEGADGHQTATRLRALGAGAVCAIQDFRCEVWSDQVSARFQPFPTALQDSVGAHAAFSAALVYRLVSTRRPAERTDYVWATAAMVATQSIGDVPAAMPLVSEVERIYKLATEEH
ncbi:carbohydrate kinase family protein [Nocardia sp. CDC186]|uniref:Carbohydrate kinase family protein n=1 Tax=Nocardia implantans TaxID=3108168 RepID=A0ABU6B2C1_9NOCA|nr:MULTISPECIES: carbohydrate kinase family protein [unclassified Nocardia]MEA3531748.1 carbohydrate kinase family protein [Nocardia sp. CDC192]MEB3513913.1 carbohydrate kinase family protein [Nocardia sp. CDC186]